jgi:thiol-disulfide isomerase/thioredoxin
MLLITALLLVLSLAPHQTRALPDLGPAPELTGLQEWINSAPTSLVGQRGKVVLVKFWAFDCINCRRTMAATQSWYDRYHRQGFEILAIHTPELAVERIPANVRAAVRHEHITYPVALDPFYATWRAYDNHYWPAAYLIDARGHLRFVHIGEGAYDEMDRNIALLLAEVSPKR